MTRKRSSTHDLRGTNGNGGNKWSQALETERRGRVRWSDCGPEDLLAALVAVTEDGAALLLSQTSDGGALAIHVLAGGDTHKLYPATMAELTEALTLITTIASGA